MKLGIALGVAALLATVAGAPAFAQSASGSGSITVYRPLTVTKNTDLAFGTVIEPANSAGNGTVVVASTGGTRTYTGGVTGTASNVPTSAQFTVGGEGGAAITVTVPASFNVASGSNSLTVTTSTNLAGGTGATTQTLSGALGSAGSLTVGVGGSIPILNTTPSGAYTGTFTVSAAYN